MAGRGTRPFRAGLGLGIPLCGLGTKAGSRPDVPGPEGPGGGGENRTLHQYRSRQPAQRAL